MLSAVFRTIFFHRICHPQPVNIITLNSQLFVLSVQENSLVHSNIYALKKFFLSKRLL